MEISKDQFNRLATKDDLKDLKSDVKDLKQGQDDLFEDLNSLREEHEEYFTAIKKDLSKLDKLDSIERVTKATFDLVSGEKEERQALKGRIGVVEEAIKELKEKKGVVYQSID